LLQRVEFEDCWARLRPDETTLCASTRETLGSLSLSPTLPAGSLPRTAEPPAVERLWLGRPAAGAAPAGEADLTVERPIGEGGMGAVPLARQPALRRDVAVKVARVPSEANEPLLQEAQLTGSLEHPSIIPVHAIAFDARGVPGLVMKRVDGVTWSQRLRDEPVHDGQREHLERHLQILVHVCNAVAYAHSHGILHRDIKPANVLLGEYGEVYVSDWGVALRKDAPRAEPALKGTPAYLAPEMVTGLDADTDERTDVFLLGATLYELLSGEPPWSREDTVKDALLAAWTASPAPLPASAPRELKAICMKAMARDKTGRYATVLELRDALEQFLAHWGSHRLADATAERLDSLTRLLSAPGARREQIAPLAAACRFGFQQALADWPENPVAAAGLVQTVTLAARFEIAGGNAAAARAWLTELPRVPPELEQEVAAAEARAEAERQRAREFTKVERELNPRLYMAQRAGLFVALAIAVIVASLGPLLFPAWAAFEASLGRWAHLSRMVPSSLALLGSVTMWRRQLLGTTLNRRFVGIVVISLGGMVVNRLVCALMGIPPSASLVLDLAYLGLSAACFGIVFHRGFFVQCIVAALGTAGALALPGYERPFFSASVFIALLVVLVTWARWRSDLGSTDRPD
jgi:serine/threonine-protein kinase